MDQFGCILVIRMKHDHDVGGQFEGHVVTGFLVPPISPVPGMRNYMLDAQLFGLPDGVVLAEVVHQDHVVNDVERDFPVCLSEQR